MPLLPACRLPRHRCGRSLKSKQGVASLTNTLRASATATFSGITFSRPLREGGGRDLASHVAGRNPLLTFQRRRCESDGQRSDYFLSRAPPTTPSLALFAPSFSNPFTPGPGIPITNDDSTCNFLGGFSTHQLLILLAIAFAFFGSKLLIAFEAGKLAKSASHGGKSALTMMPASTKTGGSVTRSRLY